MSEAWQAYWPYVALFVSTAIGAVAATHAAMKKDDVRAAIGWVGVIMLSPVVGAFLYLVAGINRIRRSSIGVRRARVDRRSDDAAAELGLGLPPALLEDPRLAAMKRLGDRVSPFPLALGNEVRLLDGGDEAYPAMLAAIDGARRHVMLSTYIFDNDPIGERFAEALGRAVARGVSVRVLIDGVGARYSRPPITRTLREKGVTTALFMGSLLPFNLPYANLRNHRKVLVVDGEIGFTGGLNIRAGFASPHAQGRPARDTHFAIRGPVLRELAAVFADDWSFTTGELLRGALWGEGRIPDRAGKTPARVVISGPDSRLPATHTMIMGALAAAESSIRLCSPYFLPDQQLVAAFSVAALRGVAVDIVIPAENNLRLVDYAMTAQLDQVIATGCRVWRAPGPFNHSKLLVVDGQWGYVGSSNLDPRSLRLNFELDLEIVDRDFAGALEARLLQDIEAAEPETLETLRARPFPVRLRNRIVWLASPYL